MEKKLTKAGVLEVGYLEFGQADGPVAILLHGFPYDALACVASARILAGQGWRVFVPWLRGYGPTRFLSDATPRSGQQAALAADAMAFMDALGIARAVLAGYDWGGRAATILAALQPQRVAGLVSCGVAYNLQNIPLSVLPTDPAQEARLWYQYYFHGARGMAGLAENRGPLCRLLWQMWSPAWAFSDATYSATAAAFDNPDFVEVVIHSYRHRFALVAGDPAYDAMERALEAQPSIGVPSIVLLGGADNVAPPDGSEMDRSRFDDLVDWQILPGIGHNLPQEAPEAFARAVARLGGLS